MTFARIVGMAEDRPHVDAARKFERCHDLQRRLVVFAICAQKLNTDRSFEFLKKILFINAVILRLLGSTIL